MATTLALSRALSVEKRCILLDILYLQKLAQCIEFLEVWLADKPLESVPNTVHRSNNTG